MPEHFRKIWQQSNILTQNSSLMKENAAMFGTGQWDCAEFDKNCR